VNTHACCSVIHTHYNKAVESCEIAIHVYPGLIPPFQRGTCAGAGDVVPLHCVVSRDANHLFCIVFHQYRWAVIIDRLLIIWHSICRSHLYFRILPLVGVVDY
jgi:hypothetical protein